MFSWNVSSNDLKVALTNYAENSRVLHQNGSKSLDLERDQAVIL